MSDTFLLRSGKEFEPILNGSFLCEINDIIYDKDDMTKMNVAFTTGTLTQQMRKDFTERMVTISECDFGQIILIKDHYVVPPSLDPTSSFPDYLSYKKYLLRIMLFDGRNVYSNFFYPICDHTSSIFCYDENCSQLNNDKIFDDIRFCIYRWGKYYIHHMISEG